MYTARQCVRGNAQDGRRLSKRTRLVYEREVVYLKKLMTATRITSNKMAPTAKTARTRRLAAPILRNVPAIPVMVNLSPGRTMSTERTGGWKPPLRRIIQI